MHEHDVHGPDYSGTTESEWDAPRMGGFEADDLSSIDDDTEETARETIEELASSEFDHEIDG